MLEAIKIMLFMWVVLLKIQLYAIALHTALKGEF